MARGRRGETPKDPPSALCGGVYYTSDKPLRLPPWIPARTPHEQRPVVVVNGMTIGQDVSWPFALVIPTSTEPEKVTRFCVRIDSHRTWARVPAVQPLMKADLGDRLGLVTPDELLELRSRLVQYLELDQ